MIFMLSLEGKRVKFGIQLILSQRYVSTKEKRIMAIVLSDCYGTRAR